MSKDRDKGRRPVARRRERAAESTVVQLPAEIDLANAAMVAAELRAAASQGSKVVIADMSHTRFCDCAGVAALLSVGRDAASQGSELRVAASARAVLRVFELAGVLTALRVELSIADAASAPQSGQASPPPGAEVVWLSRRRGTGAAPSAPRPSPPQCP